MTTTVSSPLPRRRDVAHRPTRPTAAADRLGSVLAVTESLARRAAPLVVRGALAVLLLWFGAPKLVAGGSPAEDLAVRTVDAMSAGIITGDAARVLVGLFEVGLGIALLVGRCMPLVLLAVCGHLVATASPLVLFPDETWRSPMVGSLEGQYIIKNLLIVAGVVVLAGSGLRRRP